MFHFIHSYLPDTGFWEGLVRRGFIDDTSGVKLPQSAPTPENHCFNIAAAKGGPLWAIIREANRPFYVDRLQGGTYYYDYPWDQSLIREYEGLLGEKFLGFQMHEWASNLRSDFQRIKDCLAPGEAWDEAGITRAVKRRFPYPYVFLESRSAAQWAVTPPPETGEDWLGCFRALFAERQQAVRNRLLPADSYLNAARLEAELGARALMPEIGAQTPYTRVQIALARGTARAKGLQWGAYQEPWGGDPFSTCYYKQDPPDRMVNEWWITSEADFPYAAGGAKGGSSLALLRRIFFYAYLSGAGFLSEEWGACNTFLDWEDFPVSPYGRVKKEFLDFAAKNPDRGEPFTPFALVLPREMAVFSIPRLGNDPLFCPEPAGKQIQAVCRMIYGSGESRFGSREAAALTNSPFGDLFDLVYEDAPGIFDRYAYAVDLTGKSSFAAAHPGEAGRILAAGDTAALARQLQALTEKLLPFAVEGDVHWLANRTENGWILGFFHNDGIMRNQAEGEYALPGSGSAVTLTIKGTAAPEVLAGTAALSREGGRFHFTLGAGEVLVLKTSGNDGVPGLIAIHQNTKNQIAPLKSIYPSF